MRGFIIDRWDGIGIFGGRSHVLVTLSFRVSFSIFFILYSTLFSHWSDEVRAIPGLGWQGNANGRRRCLQLTISTGVFGIKRLDDGEKDLEI